MKRILVVRNDKIGDFMLAWPSFAMLKRSMDCHVTALVPAYTAPLARLCPWIDEIILDPGSRADKERTVILAEAQKQASLLRGAGEGKAAEIHAEAYNRDPEFYRFYRSLQAYREVLKNTDTTLILSPDSTFLKFFNELTDK